MKKLILIAAMAFFCVIAVHAQDRESNEPTIQVSGHPVSIDFKLPRYSYQSSSQDWQESEQRPILGYGRVVYAGTEYVVVVIRSSISRYKYPNIKEGYSLTSLNGYAIFTEEDFNKFLDIDEEEKTISPIAYISFANIGADRPFVFDKEKLFEIERVIENETGHGFVKSNVIDPSKVSFQVKRWKDVARFNIPTNTNTAGDSETFGVPGDMSKAYYEIPYDDYILYVQMIKNNEGAKRAKIGKKSGKK